MFEILSSLFKYVFVVIIYIFIFNTIRLIIIDIRSMNEKTALRDAFRFIIKVSNIRGVQDFKIEDAYYLKGNTSIGRSPESTICIEDSFLSLNHAIFEREKNNFYLKDCGSTNGTLLNGRRIGSKPVRMKNGDKISLGRIEFIFVREKRKGDK